MDNEMPKLVLSNETPKNQENTPVLTLSALDEVATAEKASPESTLSVANLTPNEQKYVRDFAAKIDINDSQMISAYGAPAQQKVAGSSDAILQGVKTKDLGAIGDDLSSLVVEIKRFSEEDKSIGNLFGLLDKASRSVEKIAAKYSKTETNIDKIVSVLEGHKRQLYKDIAMLDMLYSDNFNYFKEISMYIIAGNERLKEYNEVDIPRQRELAERTKDEVDIQKLNDMLNAANRFDKRLHDLKLTRTISLQMAPQIRLIQNNDTVLAEKIQSSIVNAIPLWKNQMVIALGLANSKAALRAQTQVTDMTNELLVKNSEMLKQGSVEIAREAERGVVSIETIKKTNENLITTINDVLNIQQQGSANRREAELELAAVENELKTALMQAGGKGRQ